MLNILDSNRFTKITLIDKGWSGDKKYCVTDETGTRYLLRMRLPPCHQARPALFEMMQRVAALGVPTSIPIETGKSGHDTHILQSWIGQHISTKRQTVNKTVRRMRPAFQRGHASAGIYRS